MINTNRPLHFGAPTSYTAGAYSPKEKAIEKGPSVPVESYTIASTPEEAAKSTDFLVQTATSHAKGGYDVSVQPNRSGPESVFTDAQSKNMSEAGVDVQAAREPAGKPSHTKMMTFNEPGIGGLYQPVSTSNYSTGPLTFLDGQ